MTAGGGRRVLNGRKPRLTEAAAQGMWSIDELGIPFLVGAIPEDCSLEVCALGHSFIGPTSRVGAAFDPRYERGGCMAPGCHETTRALSDATRERRYAEARREAAARLHATEIPLLEFTLEAIAEAVAS